MHIRAEIYGNVFKTLKKRSKVHYRPVPVPENFLDALNLVHDIRG